MSNKRKTQNCIKNPFNLTTNQYLFSENAKEKTREKKTNKNCFSKL